MFSRPFFQPKSRQKVGSLCLNSFSGTNVWLRGTVGYLPNYFADFQTLIFIDLLPSTAYY